MSAGPTACSRCVEGSLQADCPCPALSPLAALQRASIIPARFLDRPREMETVADGKLAVVVLLDKNSLDSIGNTERMAIVKR